MRYFLTFLCMTLAIVCVTAWHYPARAAEQYLTIGTGGVTGVYFPAGGAICRLINLGYKEHGINCSVQSTPGSIHNLEALRKGDLQLGVAQSDWQYHAYHGTRDFKETGADAGLRSVFSLHSEPFTVLVRADSDIKTFADIPGHRINVGNPGSGMRATMNVVMRYTGWRMQDFAQVSELSAMEQGKALCDNKVDVVIYTAGHPNGAVQEVTSSCPARLISVTGASIARLMKENPFYTPVTIPGGMYDGNMQAVATFGVRTTFVSQESTNPELIYQVVKALGDNFDNFKTLHPVFSTLDPRRIPYEGNTAPLHEGALRYYREQGWLEEKSEAASTTPTEPNG